MAGNRENFYSRGQDKMPSTHSENEAKLFVGNVPVEICKKDILFSSFMVCGQVKDVYVHPSNPGAAHSWGFVTYFSKSDADNAMKEFNSLPPYFLKVEYSRGKNKSNESGVRGFQKKSLPGVSRDPSQLPHTNYDVGSDCVSTRSLKPFEEQEILPSKVFVKAVIVYNNCPFEYWVVLHSNYKEFITMASEMEAVKNSSRDITPNVGHYCMAKFEGAWFRAKIMAVEPKIKVFYIDFGNYAEIDSKDLRELPKCATKLKSQAISVKLTPGTSSKYGSLEIGSEINIKVIREEQSFYIVCVEDEGAWEGADDEEEEEEEEVEEQKKKEEEEVLNKPVMCSQRKNVACHTSILFEDGQHVLVSSKKNEMFVRPVRRDVFEKLEKVQKILEAHCEVVEPLETSPEVGEVLAAKFDDNLYYRAVVTSVQTSGIRVEFIDFGNDSEVPLSNLKLLPHYLLDVPALGITIIVERFIPSVKDFESVSESLEKYAESEELLQIKSDSRGNGTVTVKTPDFQVMGKICQKKLCGNGIQKQILTYDDMEPEMWKEGADTEIFINFVYNYGRISGTLENSTVIKKLSELKNDICKTCDKLPPYEPAIGELCFVKDYDGWHRAYCQSKAERINFVDVDSRKTYYVHGKKIRKMPEEYTTLPSAAVDCKIHVHETMPRKDKFAVFGLLSSRNKVRITVLSTAPEYIIGVHEVDELFED